MSSIPKAERSTITDLSVFPDEWDGYPKVDRSQIHGCIYRNLNSATRISRSELTEVTIEATGNGKNEIERSELRMSSILNSHIEGTTLVRCSVSGARLEYCKLEDCTLSPPNTLERTNARSTKFVSSGRIERSELDDCVVMGKSRLERSVFKNSVIADSTQCERSELDNVVITRSRTERSKVKDCDVMDCEISRTDFEGMILKYGIWKNGDLVGRTSKDHEVVIMPRHAPTPRPAATEHFTAPPTPGWKAAEAERDAMGVDSDYAVSSPSEIAYSSDDEAPRKDVKSRSIFRDANAPDPSLGPGQRDPPPPYET